MKQELIPHVIIEKRIYLIRHQKVMLDFDLAELYNIPTKNLKRAVKRNISRFPEDFMIVLDKDELKNWRHQFGTSNYVKMGLRYAPMAFTELGVAMLSSVLNSGRAVSVNIEIMRAFVNLREITSTHKDLARKLEQLEGKYDAKFKIVFDALRELTNPPVTAKKELGFKIKEPRVKYSKKN